MPRILAIDPGSTKGLGWALMDGSNLSVIASGHAIIKVPTGSRDRTAVWGALLELLDTHGPAADVLAYEDVARHSSVWAAHLYGGQVAHIQHWAAAHRIPFQPVPVMTVKRFLRSKASGKAKEVAQVEAAHALGYIQVTDSNEADAIGIALGGLWLLRQKSLH